MRGKREVHVCGAAGNIWPLLYFFIILILVMTYSLLLIGSLLHTSCRVAAALVAPVAAFIIYHRWKYPRRKDRVMAFFHPHCSSGGGGERVLWAIIQAIGEIDLQGLPIKVIIYTVDKPSENYKKDVLEKVQDRFALSISSSLDVSYIHLDDCVRFLDKASRLSLVVESWGTMRLAYAALVRSKSQVPGIFMDTTGCAFTYFVARIVFGCKVIAYVHYPTISTDMLSMVWERRRVTYNNQAYITSSRITTIIKLFYYTVFALVYGCVGSMCQLVLVNSTWTYNHIKSLWLLAAIQKRIHVVFPPCRISGEQNSPPSSNDVGKRERIILSIGQFRPEKDHELQIESLAKLFENHPTMKGSIKMVMVGGVRGPGDRERLEHLKAIAKKRGLESSVIFSVNQPYSVVEDWLRRASVGIHTMWNEHFGIGVVEMMSAGLITIAHDSGGPKSDIIIPFNGNPTGLLASSAEAYADAIFKAFTMDESQVAEMRKNARISAARFSDERFNTNFKRELLESRLLD